MATPELIELNELKVAVVCTESERSTWMRMAASAVGEHHTYLPFDFGVEIPGDVDLVLLYADRHFRSLDVSVEQRISWLELAILHRPGVLMALSPEKAIGEWLRANGKVHRGMIPDKNEFRNYLHVRLGFARKGAG